MERSRLQDGFLVSTSECQHGDLNGVRGAIDLMLFQHRILAGSTVNLGYSSTTFVNTRRRGFSIGLKEAG